MDSKIVAAGSLMGGRQMMVRAAARRVTGSLLAGMVGAAALLGVGASPAMAADGADSVSFHYTGAPDTFTVPAHVSHLHVRLLGGAGGSAGRASGGAGGDVQADLPVGPAAPLHAGDQLTVRVAGVGGPDNGSDFSGPGGYNGGGTSGFGGAGGGGASDLRTAGGTLQDRLAVAAGGGGVGNVILPSPYNDGGDPGQPGDSASGAVTYDVNEHVVPSVGGGGATATHGGSGDSFPDTEGTFGQGGAGGKVLAFRGQVGGTDGGGGGGGWYGGGGGAGGSATDFSGLFEASSGGGGSNYTDPAATHVQIATTREAPAVTISWTTDTTAPVIAAHSSVAATAAAGTTATTVSYPAPTAVDEVDGSVPVACTPVSGGSFPVATTPVTCTAADQVGNTASSRFDVVVSAAVTPPTKADLKVAVAGPASVKSGTKATYTVTVSNAGPAAAAKLDTALAATGLGGLTATPAAGSGSVKLGSTTVSGSRWSQASLASSGSVTYSVSGTVTAKAGKTISLVALAVSTTPDPATGNNLTVVSTKVS